MNSGPWAAPEREDLKQGDLQVIIHIGELREFPDYPHEETHQILKGGVTVLNKLFKARDCRDKQGNIFLVCYGFRNERPTNFQLKFYEITLEDIWIYGGRNLLQHDLEKIVSVNGQGFNVNQFKLRFNI